MKLVWRAEARQDLSSILAYIGERNQRAADDLLDRVNACAGKLPDHPFLYRAGRREGTREAVVHPNYILVYRVTAGTVEIVNVLHTRREYPPAEPQ